jgi:hypothetical protein
MLLLIATLQIPEESTVIVDVASLDTIHKSLKPLFCQYHRLVWSENNSNSSLASRSKMS